MMQPDDQSPPERDPEAVARLALGRWREALGAAAVVTDPSACRPWGQRTFGEPVRVAAVLRPRTPELVAAALAIATAHGVPIHPVSRGANWGLGSRAPTVEGAVVLDLSGLDAIAGYDAEQGLVDVQPGVTFEQLTVFLLDRRSRFYLPEIGGPMRASVLANALERGDASLCDRWSSIGELEVALPNGSMLRTGHGAIGATRLAGASTPPVGAIVDGLFSQSNLGVVTGATLRLEAMPSDLAAMVASVGDLDGLPAFLRTWRECLIDRSLPDRSMSLWNGVKLLAREGVRRDLPAGRVAAAAREWHASALIPAESPEVLQPRAVRLQRSFEAVAADCRVSVVRSGGIWLPGCETLLGVPGNGNLRTVYWYQPSQPGLADMDPDSDGCGLIWLCLAFPFDGEVLADYLRWAERRLAEASVDLNVGIVASSFRCLLANITIGYDRDRPGADEAAIEAYCELLEEGLRRGLAPYRLANGLPVPDRLSGSPLAGYVADIRAIGDPAGILSPGRVGVGRAGVAP